MDYHNLYKSIAFTFHKTFRKTREIRMGFDIGHTTLSFTMRVLDLNMGLHGRKIGNSAEVSFYMSAL